MTNENLLMEVVRMFREREDYFDKQWLWEEETEQATSAAMSLGKATAYNSARQMLMAALTGNEEILQEYDVYHQED